MYFVNLNLRAVRNDPQVLERFLERGVNPELGLDPVLMDMTDMDWHEALAGRLRAEGLTASLHLPFFDLQPGSADELIRQASLKRLQKAMDVARVYGPAHMVGHASYDHLLYVRTYQLWRERAADTWSRVLESWPEHPPLYLENTHEPDPSTVSGMAELLARRHGERVALCLDIGHWHSFAGGKERGDLDDWLDVFAPRLGHLHLHDNDGSADSHLGPGQGGIPWRDFFEGLARRGLTPSVTFEPHTEEAFTQALDFVRARPEWFAPLRVRAPRIGG
jgi:sugar phosphate isomerase/epimerase